MILLTTLFSDAFRIDAAMIHFVFTCKGRHRKPEVFRKFFSEDENGIPTNSLRMRGVAIPKAIGIVGGGHAQVKLRPEVHVFTMFLKSFTLWGDQASVTKAVGIVMILLAHGKDSATTEAIYTRAIKDGTVADTVVMNAHTAAASRKGARLALHAHDRDLHSAANA